MKANDQLKEYFATEQYHRFTSNLLLTDGAKAMAEKFKCYWFLDIIWSYQIPKVLKKCDGFQVWKLKKKADGSAVVRCEDGDKKKIVSQTIPYTDFEANEAELWLKEVVGIDHIINLRSESEHDEKMCQYIAGMTTSKIDVKDHQEPTLEQANNFIAYIKDAIDKNKRVLFHCKHGHGRTSTFCILARLAMGWTLDKAIKEEEEKFHYHFKHPAQIEFLKKTFF